MGDSPGGSEYSSALGFLPQQCFLQCSFFITVPFYTLHLDGAFCCTALFSPPFFLCPFPVWAAWPGGGADHGAAVWQHAAGLQRGAIQEAHRHAEAAQEALPRWRGQWQIREVAVGVAVLHRAKKWINNLRHLKKSTRTLLSSAGRHTDFVDDKYFASSKEMEEVGV